MSDTLTLTTTGPMSGAELVMTVVGIIAAVLIFAFILHVIGAE